MSLRRASAGITIVALAALAIAPARVACQPREAAILDFPSTDFLILSTDDAKTLGHSRYEIVRGNGGIALRGENRYLDGSYDIELDRLKIENGAPALASFNHSFFATDGSPLLSGHADLATGMAVCNSRMGSEPETYNAKLDFPNDTWAGSSVVIPIQLHLRSGGGKSFHLHVFSCLPEPKVVAVQVSVSGMRSHWPYYSNPVVQTTARPNLGWWDVVIAPFLPKISAWFDPAAGYRFVGARLARFYRGPEIMLVAVPKTPALSRGSADQHTGR